MRSSNGTVLAWSARDGECIGASEHWEGLSNTAAQAHRTVALGGSSSIASPSCANASTNDLPPVPAASGSRDPALGGVAATAAGDLAEPLPAPAWGRAPAAPEKCSSREPCPHTMTLYSCRSCSGLKVSRPSCGWPRALHSLPSMRKSVGFAGLAGCAAGGVSAEVRSAAGTGWRSDTCCRDTTAVLPMIATAGCSTGGCGLDGPGVSSASA
mmetsp:Transcript_26826/g.67479  ORF Transcript_26826/g.67479 Transcript_26826/m.67479 type:complete len:212 (+) Transcript_26826:1225-1860(+)